MRIFVLISILFFSILFAEISICSNSDITISSEFYAKKVCINGKGYYFIYKNMGKHNNVGGFIENNIKCKCTKKVIHGILADSVIYTYTEIK